MKEQFVTYEIALKLKELGFGEECLARYEEYELVISQSNLIGKRKFIQAPLWQQVIDWFRNEKNLEINITQWGVKVYIKDILQPPYYIFDIETAKQYNDDWIYQSVNDDLEYKTYEEAREASILKAIEICQNKKS